MTHVVALRLGKSLSLLVTIFWKGFLPSHVPKVGALFEAKVILFNLPQPPNAAPPIFSMDLESVIVFTSWQASKHLSGIAVKLSSLISTGFWKVTVNKERIPRKANFPIFVMVLGMVRFLKALRQYLFDVGLLKVAFP